MGVCMLPSEADDAVQEARLRFSRVDTSDVENLRGWLKTIVAPVASTFPLTQFAPIL